MALPKTPRKSPVVSSVLNLEGLRKALYIPHSPSSALQRCCSTSFCQTLKLTLLSPFPPPPGNGLKIARSGQELKEPLAGAFHH